ncbi:MAG: hypothetical protein QOI01_7056 [Mycobacterium sp.]|jgi:hypothetical protein|nr:hypothetical protein [Mycobacterium sp.]
MKLWLTRADLVARNLNRPASTTTDAHQLHLLRSAITPWSLYGCS